MDKVIINIAEDFSIIPGVREDIEGDFSGEEFLEKILLPKFNEAIKQNVKLFIDLDNTEGYATSFLEAAFGGLVRHFKNVDIVLKNIVFKSNDDAFLIDDIIKYIKAANDK